MRTLEKIDDVRAALAARPCLRASGSCRRWAICTKDISRWSKQCREACDVTVVSVFVNPLQFGPNEDFEAYPRTLQDDAALLERSGADILFAPTEQEMYPHGRNGHTTVSVPRLANILCGAHRPGHFDGVGDSRAETVQHRRARSRAFFGEKDYQQLTLIRTFCAQLDLPIEITGVPTVRAPDGLALSSRNRYLERRRARNALR